MTAPPHVDLLVFGPHPDDLEIGLGGTIARHTARGDRVGLCDLTRGELGSNGSPDEREAEAEAARVVLGAEWRVNLRWPDGGITGDDAQVADVVRLVRQARPRAVAIPYWDDRHPDHRAASEVLRRAIFRSGLRRVALDGGQPSVTLDGGQPSVALDGGQPSVALDGGQPLESWRPEWVCFYFINDSAPVSFAIDVSDHYQQKRDALACHRTQFTPTPGSRVDTRLTSPRFRQLIESRDAHLGALAGVAFAEGIVVKEPLLRESLFRVPGAVPEGPPS